MAKYKFNPLKRYIHPVNYYTGKPVAICAKRIVNLFPVDDNPALTIIDCGECVGYETYIVRHPVHAVRDMIRKAS